MSGLAVASETWRVIMNALLTTFTIGLFLLLFLEISVLLKVEVYLLTDPA